MLERSLFVNFTILSLMQELRYATHKGHSNDNRKNYAYKISDVQLPVITVLLIEFR